MKKSVLYVVSFLAMACQNVDLEKEQRAIQAQMDLIDAAHGAKDADQFYQPYSDTWTDLGNGLVDKVAKTDMTAPTQAYLDRMDFREMIQRNDPIIEISDDGTLASYIGSVTLKGVLGDTPVYWPVSWQSVLRKIDGSWKIISTANTEADEITTAKLLLDQMRKSLGNSENNKVTSLYANAECKGPLAAFKTLVLSRKTDGKLEQIFGDMHFILKHGDSASWSYNFNSGALHDGLGEEMKLSVVGHEMHWLGLWPEQRLSDAVFKPITEFNGKTAFHITMKNTLDRTVDLYYDFDTYFPLGFKSQVSDNEEDILVVNFGEWEKIEGFSVFKKAVLQHGGEEFVYDFVDIKLNQLDNETFESKQALLK